MDNEVLVALTKLEAGQQEILRRIDSLEQSRRADREVDKDLGDRLTRLEERQAFLLKVIYGGGPALTAGGLTVYHLVKTNLGG